jgi:hypothetical protein
VRLKVEVLEVASMAVLRFMLTLPQASLTLVESTAVAAVVAEVLLLALARLVLISCSEHQKIDSMAARVAAAVEVQISLVAEQQDLRQMDQGLQAAKVV